MASTNFDMDSDESYHSESEFYHPDEMEKLQRLIVRGFFASISLGFRKK